MSVRDWAAMRHRVAAAALALSFALLLVVGIAGPSAAKPALGPRGWAPGDLAWAPGPALDTQYPRRAARPGVRLLRGGHRRKPIG